MITLDPGLGRQSSAAAVEQANWPNGNLGYCMNQYLNGLDSAYYSVSPNHQTNVLLDQQLGSPLPPGWEQCLDLKSGVLFYKNLNTGSITHLDPRSILPALPAAEAAQQDHLQLRSRKGQLLTLIQAGHIKDTSDERSDYDHGSGYGYGDDCASRQAANALRNENVSADGDHIDLDLRLSSSLHTANPISQPTASTTLSSSSTHASSIILHMNSQSSSHAHLSDARMQGRAYNPTNEDNYVHAQHFMQSMSLSSSSSSTSASPERNWHKCEGIDEADIDATNTNMATAACMRCLMFVLVSSTKEPMRCPLCGCEAVNALYNL